MIDPMYPIYICLGILALWFFAEKLPEIEERGATKRRLSMSYDELLMSARNYINIARQLKVKGDKDGAIARYQYAIKLLQSIAGPGNRSRQLLDQVREELHELTSPKN